METGGRQAGADRPCFKWRILEVWYRVSGWQVPGQALVPILQAAVSSQACISGAAVDLHTGRVIWLPGTVCCYMSGQENLPDDFEPIVFRKDSRLIELSGQINETGAFATHTYVLQGGRFVHLADRPLPGQSAPAGLP